SQIIEQVVKLFSGLLFAYLFLPNLNLSVAGATLGITISEIVAFIYLFLTYRASKKTLPLFITPDKKQFKSLAKKILLTTLPITLIGVILPFSHVLDSFLTVNILGKYRADATELYGILFGIVLTVIHLPVSVCYGISTVAIPAVSGAKTQSQSNKNAVKTITLTFLVSAVCVVAVFLSSKLVIKLLFSTLSSNQTSLAVNLLKLSSPIIFFLSILQTTNGVLIGKGKPYYAILSMAFGLIIKTIVSIILMKNPTFNIYGSAIGLIACYFSACLVNLLLLTTVKVKDESTGYKLQQSKH
ncbi:MAG: polysaccharide biosynthesis C-terminal domain-containing protein, partial [Clostridia bacterium]|nr:polysaccharide biosynthesis C-terminal domain-containing protein [Clostridia bacterium]